MGEVNIKDWNEGARVRFYLNKINSRGWGVVYLFMQVEGMRLRCSLGCKVRGDYWINGGVKIPFNASKVDRLLHDVANKRMEEVRNFVDEVIYNYLVGDGCKDIIEQVKLNLEKFKSMERKQIIPIGLTWNKIVDNHYKGASKNTMSGRVGTFKRFMECHKIKDNIESLSTETIRKYKEWLINEKLSASQINQSLAFVKNVCKKMKEEGLSHNIDFDCISKVKNNISKEEKTEGNVALTREEIETLASLELTETKELVRDLFLIQCFSGVRHEDLGLFLSEKNLVGGDMVRFTPKKTERHGTTSRVPLNAYYPHLGELWNKHKGYNNEISRNTYNRNLKNIAKFAKLDRTLTLASQRGTNKIVENKKVHEVISSHDGRRTFITSMVRDFKLTPEQIIPMSGHADTTMVNNIYLSLTKEDKDKMVMEVAKGATKGGNATKTITTTKQNINDKEEAIRVLSYLGVSLTAKDIETLDFNELCRMIEMKHSDLMDNFGIDVKEVKDIFNFHKPMIVRRGLLKSMIDMIRG